LPGGRSATFLSPIFAGKAALGQPPALFLW
jgi:hypothetical protein